MVVFQIVWNVNTSATMEIHTHVVVRHTLMAFLENGILKEDLRK